jgi:trk system potassium uptake protein TrkA
MRVVVVGAGEVGYHVSERLAQEKHDVVVVDTAPERLEYVKSHLDVAVLEGSGASPAVLRQANIKDAGLLVAVTNHDEVNLVSCAAARGYKDILKIARVSNPDFYRGENRLYPETFGVDVMINPEKELALETFRMLQTTKSKDIAVFADGEIQIIALEVVEDSPAAGRTLIEIAGAGGARSKGMFTVVVRRGEETVVPTGSTRIEAGDLVYVAVLPTSIHEALALCGHEPTALRRVMVAGGSREAFYFAELLAQHDIEATLLVRERERAQELAERLNKALVLHGDATDIELLELEGVGGVDAFVALTDEDETNILSALVAKDIGARQVVTLVNKSEYAPLARRIGLDVAVSPRLSAANAILQHVRRGKVTRVALLRDTDGEAISFEVTAHSPIAGHDLASVDFPEGSIVAGVVRGGHAFIPTGSDELKIGDSVIVFALADAVDKVAHLFPA